MSETQKCSRCHSNCLLAEFKLNRIGKLGKICERCRELVSIKRKKYREEHKDEIKELNKKYYEENKDKIQMKVKQYYEANKETILEKQKQYVNEHSDKTKEYHKHYKKSTLDIVIIRKIGHAKDKDVKYHRTYDDDEYVTVDWVKNKLIKYDNTCKLCSKGLKITGYDYLDPDQFTIDRKNDDIAHIKSNCQIICWRCNLMKGNKGQFKKQ